MQSPSSPVILMTCGDPAGIGPEIVCSAWQRSSAHGRARLRVVAEATLLDDVLASRPGLPRLTVVPVTASDLRASRPEELLVIEAGSPATDSLPAGGTGLGTVTAAGGRAAATAVLEACRLVRGGQAAALVTGPLHKEALHAAGYDVPGHTELLARACGLPDDAASMMLWLPPSLGVVHVTLHESLAGAVGRLSVAGIEAAGRRLAALLERLLGRRPRLAVAALNPHAGEGGLFGDEESRVITPAVVALAAAGTDVTGPLPADTLFVRAHAGDFDGIVAMYHDQGHIAVKLLGMHRAVNITLGLPLIRTSVAHGTAFDIVGTGRADPAGMLAAIDAAIRLVPQA
jgi:4-hydroxythreonine-4-phosphate dehydrogenase